MQPPRAHRSIAVDASVPPGLGRSRDEDFVGGLLGARVVLDACPVARAFSCLRAEAPVDLGAHDAAVGGGMVVAAQQGAVEVGAGALQAFDLGIERGEAATGDRLPRPDVAGVEDAVDLVEIEAGVLEHADEDEPPDSCLSVAPLAREPSIGLHQASAFVVPDRGGGQPNPGPDLADGQQTICHEST